MSSCHHDTLVTGHHTGVIVGGSQVWAQVFATGIRSHRERHVECPELCEPSLRPQTQDLRDRQLMHILMKESYSLSVGQTSKKEKKLVT